MDHSTTILLLLIVAFLAGGFLGLLLRKAASRPDKGGASEDISLLEQRLREVSQEFAKSGEELNRKREIAFYVPTIVRRLSSRLAPNAIPGVAVRIAKDFFQASHAGYFAPLSESDEFTMVEGVGFPQGWKHTIRISPKEGILGLALENRVVVTRDEYLSSKGNLLPGSSPIEKAGIAVDLVAPVIGMSRPLGAILIGGCKVRVNEERQYASMLADLLSIAYQTALSIESVERDAAVDGLTRVYNRRYFALWFENELRRAKNYSQPLSLLMLDIDHFKKVNDTFGHNAGDMVLRKLAETLRAHTRSSDLVARYGGEEFVVAMTSSNKDQAFTYAESLRKTIASLEVKVTGHEAPLKATITCGVATYPEDGENTTDLLRAADEALYQGKGEGRNRVVRAQLVGLDGKPLRRS
jgi:diguanylate cyclase (GGDEF)-like protein